LTGHVRARIGVDFLGDVPQGASAVGRRIQRLHLAVGFLGVVLSLEPAGNRPRRLDMAIYGGRGWSGGCLRRLFGRRLAESGRLDLAGACLRLDRQRFFLDVERVAFLVVADAGRQRLSGTSRKRDRQPGIRLAQPFDRSPMHGSVVGVVVLHGLVDPLDLADALGRVIAVGVVAGLVADGLDEAGFLHRVGQRGGLRRLLRGRFSIASRLGDLRRHLLLGGSHVFRDVQGVALLVVANLRPNRRSGISRQNNGHAGSIRNADALFGLPVRRRVVAVVVLHRAWNMQDAPNALKHVPARRVLALLVADRLDEARFLYRSRKLRARRLRGRRRFLVAPRNRLLGCNLFLANFRVRRYVARTVIAHLDALGLDRAGFLLHRLDLFVRQPKLLPLDRFTVAGLLHHKTVNVAVAHFALCQNNIKRAVAISPHRSRITYSGIVIHRRNRIRFVVSRPEYGCLRFCIATIQPRRTKIGLKISVSPAAKHQINKSVRP